MATFDGCGNLDPLTVDTHSHVSVVVVKEMRLDALSGPADKFFPLGAGCIQTQAQVRGPSGVLGQQK
jgi:hypothetical protein